MFRVTVTIGACLSIAGCSLGTKSLSLNLNSAPFTKIDPNFVSSNGLGGHAGASVVSSGGRTNAPSTNSGASLLGPPTPATNPARSANRSQPGSKYQKTRLDVAAARSLINGYRKQNGLKPLSINPQLTAAAKAHSQDLAKWDRISHYGSDGSNPWDRVRRTGYKARLAAENVGTGQVTLKEVFKGWQKSAGHDKNLLLKDAEQMGIALVYDAKTEFKTFWTLVVGAMS
jgi:uncharacterized protein YkwD